MYSTKWQNEIQNVSKLRTYRQIKLNFGCEDYLNLNLKKFERSMLSQLRTGILPLRVETGRYIGEPVEQRICKLCQTNVVEDERNFILYCNLYDDIKHHYYHYWNTEQLQNFIKNMKKYNSLHWSIPWERKLTIC
jgi:hypothetical protein